MIQQAVILAAGRGTRLGQLTKDRPKSMLPILGKPIMAHIMDRIHEAGVRRFVVVIGENDSAIAAHLSKSWYPDTEVNFVIQSTPTGTVDALQLASQYLDGPFLLSSVDNLTPPEHVKNLVAHFNQASDQLATLSLITATPEQIRSSADVLLENDRVTAIKEKPEHPQGTYAAIMLYAFAPKIIDFLSQVKTLTRGERDISSAIQIGIETGNLVNYVVSDRRLHLTHELDLLAINRQFLQENRDTHILSEIANSVQIIPPVRIDPNVSVGQSTRIGPNVYLESGATIRRGAVLEDTIVLSGATVPANMYCRGKIINRRTPPLSS